MDAAVQLVVFDLDDRSYAIPLRQVERVIGAVYATPLPHAPANVLGLIDLHGKLVPVFSARHRLGPQPRPISVEDHFIIIRAAKRTVALVVDHVRELIECSAESIIQPQHILPQWNEVQGVVQIAGNLTLIQDMDRFLSLEEDRTFENALRGQTDHGN